MLSRKFRAERTNIEEAIKTGLNVPGLFLYAKISRKDSEKPGFAIVVSKKIEKTSVGRHEIKRSISAVIESNLYKISPDFKKTVVFFPKKVDKPLPYSSIKKDVEDVLKKIKAV